jgi:hypothetical protein
MRGLFNWLVKHEKLLLVMTLALVVALVLQMRFCGRSIVSEATVTSTQTELKSPEPKTTSSAGGLTGVWEMTVPNKRGAQIWTLTLTQNGKDLSGVLTSEGGDLPVSGTIKGNEIDLVAKKYGVTVEFPARLDGEVMRGTMRALTVTRQWTAKRK